MNEKAAQDGALHHEHDEEILKVRDFARTHGKSVVVAVCAAVIAVSAVRLYKFRKRSNRQEASRLLVQATSSSDLQELMSTYPSTPAAPLSLLKLAKVEYDMGNYTSARGRYEEFARKYPEHDLAAAAAIGQVACVEASDDRQGALEGYRNFISGHPDHFLTPQAVLGEGRCLWKLGMKEEARAVYEDFLAANPDSAWAGNAEEALEMLEKGVYIREEPVSAPDFALPATENTPPIMSPVEVLPVTPPEE